MQKKMISIKEIVEKYGIPYPRGKIFGCPVYFLYRVHLIRHSFKAKYHKRKNLTMLLLYGKYEAYEKYKTHDEFRTNTGLKVNTLNATFI